VTAGAAAPSAACVVCGQSSWGLPVCADCGGTSPSVADTLLFIDAAAPGAGSLAPRVAELAHWGLPDHALDAAAHGQRALLRLPGAAVESSTQWFTGQDIPTRVVRARRAWSALPLAFFATLGAVLVSGTLAGTYYSGWMLVSTALLASLLLASAVRGIARPILGEQAPGRGRALAGYDALLEATIALSPSAGRDLACSLLRAARPVAGPAPEFPAGPGLAAEVDGVLDAAAEAARDLVLLDETMQSFAERDGSVEVEGWHAGRAQVLASRDRLEAYLLEATGLVGRIQGLGADAFDAAGERLRELTRELREAMARA
jgi:hypothetical protein